MSTLDKKIRLEYIADILFCIYLAMSFLSERTILGQLSMLFYVVVCLFLILINGKIKLSFYFVLELLFIGYCILQNAFGITEDLSASQDMIKTLLICTVVYICLYNYALIRKKYLYILKLFFLSYLWAILINLTTGDGINIGGIAIGGVISVSVGWISGICIVLAVIIYSRQEKKWFWFMFAILTSILILSGTRKALLFIPIALFGWFYVLKHRKNVFKLFMYLIVIAMICIIGYYISISNEILYSTFGYQFENVIKYMTNGSDSIEDASMLTRLALIKKAEGAYQLRPVTGWGLDNFRYIFNNGGYYAHNNFLEILVSGGWIGFVLYYFKYVYVIISLWNCRKYVNENDRNRIYVFLLLATVMTILEYWQVTYYTRKSMMVWIMMLIFADSLKSIKKIR
jgi:O-antigen ligase